MSDRTSPSPADEPGDGAGRLTRTWVSVLRVLGRTRFAIGVALRRLDSLAVFVALTLVYTVGYLFAVQQFFPGGSGFAFRVAADPWNRLFRQANSAVNFEPIALIETDFFTYLVGMNTVIGLGIGVLVGINLAITYLAWRQPAACGIGSSSAGLLAGIPALLSGSACCGPVVLLVFGVQATGIFAPAMFEILLPVAVFLLFVSLLLIGRRIDPERVAAGSAG